MDTLDSLVPAQPQGGADLVLDLTAPPAKIPVRRRTLSGPGTRYLPYRYTLYGLVRIGSQVPLAELDYFLTPTLASDYDIELRVGPVGRGLRRRTVITSYATPSGVDYDEHLGRLGANFRLRMGDSIDLTVSPLLARSPHVVYTNIVEALLRFVLVTRGRMLLHSACLEIDGRGVLLSARTDTGKTGTVLRLVRKPGVKFLSDDMTIIDAQGQAWAFPKPLTISEHTLRAVNVDELPRGEWRRLRVQSRLHSKGGRSIGMALGEHNVPIMAMNALTQLLIPPPKYAVDRLVDCEITETTNVSNVFIIERGNPSLHVVPHEQSVAELMANTDDAYCFPPFRYFAPALTVDGADYRALRVRELEILRSALQAMAVRRIASDDFSWAESIPLLLSAEPNHHDGHHREPHQEAARRRLRHPSPVAALEPTRRNGRVPDRANGAPTSLEP